MLEHQHALTDELLAGSKFVGKPPKTTSQVSTSFNRASRTPSGRPGAPLGRTPREGAHVGEGLVGRDGLAIRLGEERRKRRAAAGVPRLATCMHVAAGCST